MAWKDLSIAQRSQLMNIMRQNGISSLSEMRRLYDLSSPSLSSLEENTFNMQPQAPVYDGGGEKPPYNGEIRQGKKWNFIDHYLADNPRVAHGLRKAGVLLSDAGRIMFPHKTEQMEINPRILTDFKDIAEQVTKRDNPDSAADRMSRAATPLAAFARVGKPLLDDLNEEVLPWAEGVRNFANKLRIADRIVNMGQFIDDFATPVEKFGNGGKEERRKAGDHYLTLEQYKELQRDTIRQAALQKALTRTEGVAPIIDGKPASSCIYTFTDNYGKKYQVAGTQTFAANPEKYGFEVAGPVTKGMEGNMYLMIDESGKPYHANMITGYDTEGNPLVTYSQGHAGINGPGKDYHKNKPLWYHPGYETYRFVGTPDDNTLWEQQFSELQEAPTQVEVPQVLNNQIQLGDGGHKIHIKKANRGKFTALKKRTGHSASWFKAHGTPAQRKMATFALNAKHWKHSHGGIKF